MEQWQRFELYARRVRNLCVTQTILKYAPALDTLARIKPPGALFPHLLSLEWCLTTDAFLHCNQLEYSFLFLGDTVKRFTLLFHDHPKDSTSVQDHLTPYMSAVARRVPGLTDVDLRSSSALGSKQIAIITLIKALPNLQSITFPAEHLTRSMMEILATAPRLQRIRCTQRRLMSLWDLGLSDYELELGPPWPEDAFSSITHLELLVPFPEFTDFIRANKFAGQLSVLSIESSAWENPAHFHDLLAAISLNCPQARELHLLPHNSPDGDRPTQSIALDDLEPLFQCRSLTMLELAYGLPLQLDMEDLETLASGMPDLENLNLNSHPAYRDDCLLTLSSLLSFACHCKKLKCLGLFLDAAVPVILPSPDLLHSFHSLRELDMGVSFIADEGPVAQFLSYITPEGCRVKTSAPWNVEVYESPLHWLTIWNRVDAVLPWLIPVRRQEAQTRARMHELEAELNALRAQQSQPG